MREMRRTDRKINEEEALKILMEGEYGILATVDDDGQPYGVPLSYVVIDNSIYYHSTNAGGYKHGNILNNNKVSFTVVGNTQVLPDKFGTLFESAIAFGEADIVNDEEERMLAFREFLKKYSEGFLTEGEKYIQSAGPKAMIVKISIDRLTGKRKTNLNIHK
ncbi:pyridoxamine 5'-phosphate oxidase family protein [Sinanaerobacter chloroacetimidivorans]|uniref:Pyridoxamine 5'-phosphate oxidase family protein n=1 Tax=Sinanaerobacter chloroacetimidivorans TaxID=2818044 RepID=A0A8J7W3S3_9FIRM|nr:pyridoxamine 5'-phosphate oxidase family protein [Sinanaerobacter chloroacetimidivorans]MBR0598623.1 pyridoxamine 5'-phosphate oxidase family protein [Sinanaerobacter chloroacetimidivorans]